MNKNNSKKIFSLSLLLFIVVFSAAFVFRFYINNMTQNVVDLKQEAVVIKNSDVIALKLKFNQLSSERQKIDNYFIDSNNVAVFLDSLDLLGKQSGASFEIQSVSLEDGETGVNDLLINMNVSGEWSDVINFIITLENLDKKVLIDALRISSVFNPETGEISWNLIANIRGIAK